MCLCECNSSDRAQYLHLTQRVGISPSAHASHSSVNLASRSASRKNTLQLQSKENSQAIRKYLAFFIWLVFYSSLYVISSTMALSGERVLPVSSLTPASSSWPSRASYVKSGSLCSARLVHTLEL